MKIKVNRALTGGKYFISFDVSDFSAEELAKMESFGIPVVRLRVAGQGGNYDMFCRINQINSSQRTFFNNQEDAEAYAQEVKDQLSRVIAELRTKTDTYSSVEEVEI